MLLELKDGDIVVIGSSQYRLHVSPAGDRSIILPTLVRLGFGHSTRHTAMKIYPSDRARIGDKLWDVSSLITH